MYAKLFVIASLLTATVALSGCSDSSSADLEEELKAANKKGYAVGYRVGFDEGYAAAEEELNPAPVVLAERSDPSTLDVEPGRHEAFLIEVTEIANLDYAITEYTKQPFDVFVVRSQLYQDYKDGLLTEDELGDHQCADLYARSTTASCRLNVGSWYLIVDHSSQGVAAPANDGDEWLRMRLEYTAWV